MANMKNRGGKSANLGHAWVKSRQVVVENKASSHLVVIITVYLYLH